MRAEDLPTQARSAVSIHLLSPKGVLSMARYRIVFSALLLFASAAVFAQAQSSAQSDAQSSAQSPAQSNTQSASPATVPAATAQSATTAQSADQPPPPPATPGGATHLMGFAQSKRNLKGKLTIA